MLERLLRAAKDSGSLAYRGGNRSGSTYRRMISDIRSCAAWLSSKGIAAGNQAIVQVTDPYVFWVLFFALEIHKVTVIALPHTLPPETYINGKSSENWIFSSSSKPADVSARWIHVSGPLIMQIRSFRPRPLPQIDRRADDIVCVLISSGTTGMPKRVPLTRNMIELRVRHGREAGFLQEGARVACTLPFTSIGGVLAGLQSWLVGGTFVIPGDQFDWCTELQTGRINNVVAAPFHLERILGQLPDAMPKPSDLIIICGGATPSHSLIEDIRHRLTDQLTISYGTTETGLVTKGEIELVEGCEGNAGTILPWMTVEILSPNRETLGIGEEGEVRIQGDELASGYVELETDSRTHFKDGWYYPGDLGFLDEKNCLTITGRVDDLINFEGRKALPATFEAAVMSVQGVTDVATFSTKDSDGKQVLAVCYCGEPPKGRESLLAVLPPYPRIWTIRVAAIPRNGMGKIERALLRSKIEDAAKERELAA